jgi:hypothetical protein
MPGIPVKENTIHALASEVVSVVLMYIPTGGTHDYTGEEAFRCLWGALFLYYYNVVFRWCFYSPLSSIKIQKRWRASLHQQQLLIVFYLLLFSFFPFGSRRPHTQRQCIKPTEKTRPHGGEVGTRDPSGARHRHVKVTLLVVLEELSGRVNVKPIASNVRLYTVYSI